MTYYKKNTWTIKIYKRGNNYWSVLKLFFPMLIGIFDKRIQFISFRVNKSFIFYNLKKYVWNIGHISTIDKSMRKSQILTINAWNNIYS